MERKPREIFKTRLGFLLIAAGCAVGIGNVWRFPFIVGQYGGAYFVLLYLFFLVTLGIPLLTVELALVEHQEALWLTVTKNQSRQVLDGILTNGGSSLVTTS